MEEPLDLASLRGVEAIMHISAKGLYCPKLESLIEAQCHYLKNLRTITVRNCLYDRIKGFVDLDIHLARILNANFGGLQTFVSDFCVVQSEYVKEVINCFKDTDVSVEFKSSAQSLNTRKKKDYTTQQLELCRKNVKFAFYCHKTMKFKLFSAKQLDVKTKEFEIDSYSKELSLKRFSYLKIAGIRHESEYPELLQRVEFNKIIGEKSPSLFENFTVFLDLDL